MKGKRSGSYYPIFLNMTGRKCVVVGGGQVALRKVKGLLEFGANVEVISPDLCPELRELAETGEINVLPRRYQQGDLQGVFVAIVATGNNDVNQEVVNEAGKYGVLTNVVDDAGHSDFIVPSHLQRGNITLAISTAGSSPALARKIRTRLEEDLDKEYAPLSLLVEEVRSELKQKGIKVDNDTWQEALDLDTLIDLLKKGNRKQAKTFLLDNLRLWLFVRK